MLQLKDTALLDSEKTRIIDGGYMVCVAKSVRTGIQDYLGREVERPDLKVVRVYRPPSEVFSDASLQSFSHAPITDNHPSVMVTADNWADLAKGEVSTAAKKDGEWVSLPLILKDSRLISDVQSGKRQLSAGYLCELDWTPGVTPTGEAYDAVQTNIRINHLAVVDRARAGEGASVPLGDSRVWGDNPSTSTVDNQGGSLMTGTVLQKVMIDGLTIETTDQGAQAITKLQKQLGDAGTALAKADSDLAEEKKAKLKELAKKDEEIADLKSKVLDEAAMDAAATARGDLVAKAKAICADVKTDGVSSAVIKKTVVDTMDSSIATKLAGKDSIYVAAYYDAAFDRLTEEVKDGEQLQSVLTRPVLDSRQPSGAAKQQAAFDASVEDLNAWRNPKKA